MNRKIKFRIWDTMEKKFLSLKDYQDLGAIEFENDGTLTLSPRYRFLTSMMIMPERFIPCEYTGLKDKNGVEIYEGDIVHYEDFTGLKYELTGSVVYTQDCKFEIEYEDKYKYTGKETRPLVCHEHSIFASKKLEVIGNIYESEVEDE